MKEEYTLTLGEIKEILNATVLTPDACMDDPIDGAFASDLMSDVLAFVTDNAMLITGLINPHVIRTAEMLDVPCIVFSRGKLPSEEMLEMAGDVGITVLATAMTSYQASGELYAHGLAPTKA